MQKLEIDRGRPWQSYIRDQLQRATEDGRLPLRESRELGRARPRTCPLGRRAQQAEPLGPSRARRRQALAVRGYGVGLGSPLPRGSELHDRLRYVQQQLEAERQAHAEARMMIAGLVERIPAIEAPQDGSPAAPGSSTQPEQGEGSVCPSPMPKAHRRQRRRAPGGVVC